MKLSPEHADDGFQHGDSIETPPRVRHPLTSIDSTPDAGLCSCGTGIPNTARPREQLLGGEGTAPKAIATPIFPFTNREKILKRLFRVSYGSKPLHWEIGKALLGTQMPLPFSVPTATRTNLNSHRKVGASAQSVAAFRACYRRYEDCLEFTDSHSASPLLECASDFVLDFEIIAKRALGTDPMRLRIFRSHFLQNQDRTSCCTQFKLSAFRFAAEVMAIEQAVGTALADAKLFPLMPYFTPATRQDKIAA